MNTLCSTTSSIGTSSTCQSGTYDCTSGILCATGTNSAGCPAYGCAAASSQCLR
jgi:hypothetical protein